MSESPYINQPPGQSTRPYELCEESRQGCFSCQSRFNHTVPPVGLVQPRVKIELDPTGLSRAQPSGKSSGGDRRICNFNGAHSTERGAQSVSGVCSDTFLVSSHRLLSQALSSGGHLGQVSVIGVAGTRHNERRYRHLCCLHTSQGAVGDILGGVD